MVRQNATFTDLVDTSTPCADRLPPIVPGTIPSSPETSYSPCWPCT